MDLYMKMWICNDPFGKYLIVVINRDKPVEETNNTSEIQIEVLLQEAIGPWIIMQPSSSCPH